MATFNIFCEENGLRFEGIKCRDRGVNFFLPPFQLIKRVGYFTFRDVNGYAATIEFEEIPNINLCGSIYDTADDFEAAFNEIIERYNNEAECGCNGLVQVAFLSNTDPSVYADGEAGDVDPLGRSGWYFKNDEAGKKINWYFYGRSPIVEEEVQNLKTVWCVLEARSGTELPFINIYTRRENDGDDQGTWYRSRLVYSNTSPTLVPLQSYFLYVGEDNGLFPDLPRIELTKDEISSQEPPSGTGPTEELLQIALNTNSAAAVDDVEFLATNLGYDTKVSHRFFLQAYPDTASLAIPNGLHETFAIYLNENIDQNLNFGTFYGSRQLVNSGKYDKVGFYLDDINAAIGESAIVRFAIYDDTFTKIREATLTVDDTTVTPAAFELTFTELILTQPKLLYFVFGANDNVGGAFNIQAPRYDSNGIPSNSIVFIVNQASGALPADISAARLVSQRVYYNAIYKTL